MTAIGDPCPCGSGSSLDLCCGPLHRGLELADTPVRLMRSRYSAFVRGEVDYLVSTSHPLLHGPDERAVVAEACRTTRWLGLRILRAPEPVEDLGLVEFAAWYEGKPVGQLHEVSSFVRLEARWVYRMGTILPALVVGRNDPCWCGSGLKNKRCHPG